MNFSSFNFHPDLQEGLNTMGFETPTPIQAQAIPLLMEGHDILAVAQTGTGKTAAFLLPIINRLCESPSNHIDTIILEPTRELAMQVDQQLEGFSYFAPLSSIAVYGGRDGHQMEMEKRALKKGVNIIVATPGRLLAHLAMGYVKLDKVRHLVLDEADRMLDMGFVQDMMTIIHKLPMDRQTLFFSATMPQSIRQFTRQILRDPKEISIAISKPAEKIVQGYYSIEEGKVQLITEILRDKQKTLDRILIFSSTKKAVRELRDSLKRAKLAVESISSDLEQDQREEVVRQYKSGQIKILVATDVLSRGIDISGIDLVINYDVPNDAEDYVHRIGRTGRADASGEAITLVNRKDSRKLAKIEQLMGMSIEQLTLPEGYQKAFDTLGSSGSRGSRNASSSRSSSRPSNNSRSRPSNNSSATQQGDQPKKKKSSGYWKNRKKRDESGGGSPTTPPSNS